MKYRINTRVIDKQLFFILQKGVNEVAMPWLDIASSTKKFGVFKLMWKYRIKEMYNLLKTYL